jgi:hypothetical protein
MPENQILTLCSKEKLTQVWMVKRVETNKTKCWERLKRTNNEFIMWKRRKTSRQMEVLRQTSWERDRSVPLPTTSGFKCSMPLPFELCQAWQRNGLRRALIRCTAFLTPPYILSTITILTLSNKAHQESNCSLACLGFHKSCIGLTQSALCSTISF